MVLGHLFSIQFSFLHRLEIFFPTIVADSSDWNVVLLLLHTKMDAILPSNSSDDEDTHLPTDYRFRLVSLEAEIFVMKQNAKMAEDYYLERLRSLQKEVKSEKFLRDLLWIA